MPMKRSRVFTMHAMMSEKVANIPDPSITLASTAKIASGSCLSETCITECDKVNDNCLHDAAKSGSKRFAKNQRDAPGGTCQEFMHHAKIALPDDGDAIEDRAEQNALRENSRRDERQVAQLSGLDAANLRENLSEHHQPQHRLHRPRDDFSRIADELDQLYFHNRGTLAHESLHLFLAQPRRWAVLRVWATSWKVPPSCIKPPA